MTRTKTRTTRAYVWLTPEEKNEWKNKAASKGMNLNQFIRCCVERRKIPQPQPSINLDTARELGKIDLNLNQLAPGDEYGDSIWSGYSQR